LRWRGRRVSLPHRRIRSSTAGKLLAAVSLLLTITSIFTVGSLLMVAANGGGGYEVVFWTCAALAANIVLLMLLLMVLTVYVNNVVAAAIVFAFQLPCRQRADPPRDGAAQRHHGRRRQDACQRCVLGRPA
jgi:hypothetical protein